MKITISITTTTSQKVIMPPRTRATGPITPPKTKADQEVYTSRHRLRFFDAWDQRDTGTSLRQFCKDNQPNYSTASRWLRQRETYGSPAYRRVRKLSNKLEGVQLSQNSSVKSLFRRLRTPYEISYTRYTSITLN